MTNWEKIVNGNHFIGLGIGHYELPKEHYKWLKKEVVNAKKKSIKFNTKLIGHIREEYSIMQCEDSFESFLIDCLESPWHKTVTYSTLYDILPDKNKTSFYLDSMWVNYQKKYEFNPMHKHSGVFSFVIFIKIPYDLKKEDDYFVELDKSVHEAHTSRLCFVNQRSDGLIHNTIVNVDKSFEGKMFLFPSMQQHMVYPFYTSNDYRITISGNIKFKYDGK